MTHYIDKMNVEFANEILRWKYEQPYDFYDNEPSQEALVEMLNETYYVVLDNKNELIGFICTGGSAQIENDTYVYSEDFIDIGIGMKPELTGRGYGTPFFTSVLNYINKMFGKSPYRLTVAEFNQRAIRLYEKFGFIKEDTFVKGESKFIVMIKK